jgi:hypothetical protein
MRDKLIELIGDIQDRGTKTEHEERSTWIYSPSNEKLADHILADGWVRFPCKVGDKVYVVDVCAKEVIERKIMEIRQTEWGMIYIHSCGFGYPVISIGKTVFLSREEAEKALKGVE